MATKIPKTIEERLINLDDQLFLLDHNLRHMDEEASFVKAIAGGLRLLICSYGRPTTVAYKEGFLWRLTDELKVSDILHVKVRDNDDSFVETVLNDGAQFLLTPLARAGQGSLRIPSRYCSFKTIVEEFKAVYVSGNKSGLTHCKLIKLIAEQSGLAHEDDEIDQELYNLNQVFLNGVQPYIRILAQDAEFTLEIGERVLDSAEKQLQYKRKQRKISSKAI